MNEYKLNDIRLGMEESFEVTITKQMMDDFLRITGDNNPLHTNEEYATSMNYSGEVVYGMLTASFISTLAGVYLPGKYCLIQGVDVEFAKAVYIGDTLTVTGRVVEIHESVSRVDIKVTIYNQSGKRVCKGRLKSVVMR